jgi:anaerobic ribonucleoside-triphosphate reductase
MYAITVKVQYKISKYRVGLHSTSIFYLHLNRGLMWKTGNGWTDSETVVDMTIDNLQYINTYGFKF